jgi:hypothetical protein
MPLTSATSKNQPKLGNTLLMKFTWSAWISAVPTWRRRTSLVRTWSGQTSKRPT